MRRMPYLLMAGLGLLACSPAAIGLKLNRDALMAVPSDKVRLTDQFWKPRLETNRAVTLPHILRICEESGRIANFAKAAGRMPGEFQGRYRDDCDLYKTIEGAAYILKNHPDPELEEHIDTIIAQIASAQQPDGYINTYRTLVHPEKRKTDPGALLDLYLAGHLMEAGVAYADATGKKQLLDVARGMADYLDSLIGPGKKLVLPGHQEIELALIRLYEATGEQRYRELAQFLVEARGHRTLNLSEYLQDHQPIRAQRQLVGHAVRAMYFCCGVSDVAALTGDQGYLNAMEYLWQDLTYRKTYITGGIGSERGIEGFGPAYHLPNRDAYAETCAGIASSLWNHRLLLMSGESRFADAMERHLYNALPASVSLEGDRFFYVNPLASVGDHKRESWFRTPCCPTNIVRFLPQIPGFVYLHSNDGIWVNFYVASEAEVPLGGSDVSVVQQTEYPWSGCVRIIVTPRKPMRFSLNLRIPGWCRESSISINRSRLATPEKVRGYAILDRDWQAGDVVALELAMPVQRIVAHPAVEANRGRVAIRRGPVVFCLEGCDNPGRISNLWLPRHSALSYTYQPELLGGVGVIRGMAMRSDRLRWDDRLYQPAPDSDQFEMTAVPYAVWGNRQPGPMEVWIPESPSLTR